MYGPEWSIATHLRFENAGSKTAVPRGRASMQREERVAPRARRAQKHVESTSTAVARSEAYGGGVGPGVSPVRKKGDNWETR